MFVLCCAIDFQSRVPAGITPTLAVFLLLVKAPVISTDCPGVVSLEIQKIELLE